MAYGQHLYVRRPWGYTHHGIDVGGDNVIHFDGGPEQSGASDFSGV